MKRADFFGLLAAFAFVCSPAQGQQTKANMTTEINTNFADNTSGSITPSLARSTYGDMVNSYQQAVQVRAVVTTSDTIALADYGHLVTYNNASAIAVTLPQATGTFTTFNTYVRNLGTGAVTITPTTSTINGAATLVLSQGQVAWIVSDGTNYQLGTSTAGFLSTNIVTSGYTAAAADCGNTIQAGTGGNTLFTLALPTAASMPASCSIHIVNGDGTRGKILGSNFPATNVGILFPGQSITVRDIAQTAWVIEQNPGRWKLPGNTSVFVDPSLGNNSNDCLASGAGACLTFAQAWATIVQNGFDFNNQVVTISLANTTYTTTLNVTGGWTGAGQLIINGNSATINPSAADGMLISLPTGSCKDGGSGLNCLLLQNLTFTGASTAGAGSNAIHLTSGNVAIGTGITFGTCTVVTNLCTHINADGLGTRLTFTQNYSITGGGSEHMFCVAGAAIDNFTNITVTLTGTPNFTVFAIANTQCTMWVPGITYSGAANAGTVEFQALANSSINTGTGNITTSGISCNNTPAGSHYFPGGVAGQAFNGGTCY